MGSVWRGIQDLGQVPDARPQTGYRSSLSFGDRQADYLHLHRTRRRGRSHHSRLVNGLAIRDLAPSLFPMSLLPMTFLLMTLLPMTFLPMTLLPTATSGLDMCAHARDFFAARGLFAFVFPLFDLVS